MSRPRKMNIRWKDVQVSYHAPPLPSLNTAEAPTHLSSSEPASAAPATTPAPPATQTATEPIQYTFVAPEDVPPSTKAWISAAEKVESVLTLIQDLHWTLSDFLFSLFHLKTSKDQIVADVLNGRTKGCTFAAILDVLLARLLARARTINYRENDTTAPSVGAPTFVPGKRSTDYEHAEPAILVWAIELVSVLVRAESHAMISDPELQLRASSKSSGKSGGKEGDPDTHHANPVIGGAESGGTDDATVDAELNSQGMVIDGCDGGRGGGIAGRSKEGNGKGPDVGTEESTQVEGHRAGAESTDETGRDVELEAGDEENKKVDRNVTWKRIKSFSFGKMEIVGQRNTPVTSALLKTYTMSARTVRDAHDACLAAVRSYRPENLVSIHALLNLTCGRSSRANRYALVRGLWYVATKAGKAHFRFESRVGGCVTYDTALEGLRTAALAQNDELKELNKPGSEENALDCSDNVQAFKRVYKQRLRRESHMITGFAGTLVVCKDYEPGAFDSKPLWEAQGRLDRKKLTVPLLESSIDTEHLCKVSWTTFVRVLIEFSPDLKGLEKEWDERETALLQKNQIPLRQSEIIPLATNDSDEMTPQGMKDALADHITIQRGITDENWNGRVLLHHGDGKTFEGYQRLQKYLSCESGDITSFRALVPMPETWHTMWTDLSRVVRTSAGEDAPAIDPSSLKVFAAEAGCKMPTDLRKVDFYEGEHLVMLALRANILVIWEQELGTKDLVGYFSDKAKAGGIPSLSLLEENAKKLAARHATTKAWERALNPIDGADLPPRASYWAQCRAESEKTLADENQPVQGPTDLPESDTSSETDSASANLSELSEDEADPERDVVLANTIMFIRNAVWWSEFHRAVKKGDTGRLLEILKVWLFTFAGSKNPYYCSYLLELFCNFEWEFPPKLRQAILNNWLVNLSGQPNEWKSIDLMQEHFNFWLEDLAQHKGKEFSDKFYREVIAPAVYMFLVLKEQMEEMVQLEKRAAKHGTLHLNNELRAGMAHLRHWEVNCYEPGRDEGFEAADDFSQGREVLESGRLQSFITRTTMWKEVMKGGGAELPLAAAAEAEDWATARREDIPHGTCPPGAELGDEEQNMFETLDVRA